MNIDAGECCLVCTNPLEWTGIGPCGHNEICSRCVARMRFVLKDKNCVLCKQECPSVFFTRYAGDYTSRLDFSLDLKDKVKRGDLFLLSTIDAYFDDSKHFDEIKSLCGYTHPVFASTPVPPPRFNNLRDMARHIDVTYKMNFCEMCLNSRKVFVCEQLLYSKSQLDRHNRQGDETGPLAEGGFKGHPLCKFCKQRFYDSQELFRHMESAHEHCFVCRRTSPDKYVYYRHYKELEDHFRDDHHLCPHQNCLEKKFVVFTSEIDLKRHFASEHGGDMSRAQRREAFSVPVQIQYRGRDEADAQQVADAAAAMALHERATVVIGGGQGLMAGRMGQRSGSLGMHHSRSEPRDLNSAVQASMDSAQAEAQARDADVLQSVTFSASDFPSVGAAYGTNGTSTAPSGGLWLGGGYGGAGPSGSVSGGVSTSSLQSAEEFPALPTLSKAGRKRISQQQASLAQRLTAQAAPPRIINRSGAPPPSGPYPQLAASASFSNPASTEAYPPLASSTAGLPGGRQQATSTAAGAPSAPAATLFFPATSRVEMAPPPERVSEAVAPPPPSLEEDFPSLPPGKGASGRKGAKGKIGSPLPSPASRGTTTAMAVAPPQAAPPSLSSDFPSLHSDRDRKTTPASSTLAPPSFPSSSTLGGTEAAAVAFKAASERAASARASRGVPAGSTGAPLSAPANAAMSATDFPSLGQVAVATALVSRPSSTTAATSKSLPLAADSASAAPQGGVSEALKAANRALIDKVRSRLNSEAMFGSFREDSGRFLKGDMTAGEYHEHMVELGLLQLVPEVASLCPQDVKRSDLMRAHSTFLSSKAAEDTRQLGSSWIPPEAALAAARQAELRQCWKCPTCTLTNAATSYVCEACDHRQQGGPVDPFPCLGASASSSRSSQPPSRVQEESGVAGKSGANKQAKAKGKGTVLSIGSQRGQSKGSQQAQEPAASPASVWGQQDNTTIKRRAEEERRRLADQAAGRGAWAQSGGSKLARSIGVLNDAWGDR